MPAQVIRLSSRRFQEKRAPLQRTPLATALPIGQQSTQLLRIELIGIPEPAGHITFHHIRILREIGLKQALQLRPRSMADIEKTPLVQQIGRIQQSILESERLMPVPRRLHRSQKTSKSRIEPVAMADKRAIGRKPIFRTQSIHQKEIIIEVYKALAQTRNPPKDRLYRQTVERWQIPFIIPEKHFVVNHLHPDGSSRKIPLQELTGTRVLLVGDNENLTDKRRKPGYGSHTEINLPCRNKTGLPANVFQRDFRLSAVTLPLGTVSGVVSIHPGNHCIYSLFHSTRYFENVPGSPPLLSDRKWPACSAQKADGSTAASGASEARPFPTHKPSSGLLSQWS